MRAHSAARVLECVFEIRHLKQRIPGLDLQLAVNSAVLKTCRVMCRNELEYSFTRFG